MNLLGTVGRFDLRWTLDRGTAASVEQAFNKRTRDARLFMVIPVRRWEALRIWYNSYTSFILDRSWDRDMWARKNAPWRYGKMIECRKYICSFLMRKTVVMVSGDNISLVGLQSDRCHLSAWFSRMKRAHWSDHSEFERGDCCRTCPGTIACDTVMWPWLSLNGRVKASEPDWEEFTGGHHESLSEQYGIQNNILIFVLSNRTPTKIHAKWKVMGLRAMGTVVHRIHGKAIPRGVGEVSAALDNLVSEDVKKSRQ